MRQKQSKRQAGQAGGRQTVRRHGAEHMAAIGRKGAAVFWRRYRVHPVGQSGWAILRRDNGELVNFIGSHPGRRNG